MFRRSIVTTEVKLRIVWLVFLENGRRRVGKTETLKEFCKGKPHVFYSCTQSTDKVQLAKFSKQVFKENIPAKKYISEFADWESAFRSVLDLPYGDQKKMLIIDEFPYMCKGNKSIPSILQNLWDTDLKDQNVMIVLCGSAMSFIEKDLLAEKNPLYGRATGIYKMTEMGFYDAVKFFPDLCLSIRNCIKRAPKSTVPGQHRFGF